MRRLDTRVAFVANIDPSEESGGFSGMNSAIVKALSFFCELEYVGPVDPKPRLSEHLASKLKRLAHSKGNFFFFSKARLRDIAEETQRRLRNISHDLCFFHGFTPWIQFHPTKPYVCWSDCTFSQYMSIFHDQTRFCESDLKRIKKLEEEWLKQERMGVLVRLNQFPIQGRVHCDRGI